MKLLSALRAWWQKPSAPPASAPAVELRLPCQADLWCRKRTSLSTMLDPTLFERYTTGDERIDEEWIVQTNPPSAFRAEFKDGCDALFALLQEDPALHATKGFLRFRPAGAAPPSAEERETYEVRMRAVIRTAERELKIP